MPSDSPPNRIGRVKERWWRDMSLHGSSPAGVGAVIARVLSGRLPFLLFFLLLLLPFALALRPVSRALHDSWPVEQQHLHTVLFACAVMRQILERAIESGPFLWSLRACVLLLVLFALVALRPTPRVRTPHLIGYALILLFMIECYLPSFAMIMINPDEAQYLSQAITLRHDINYFARIDSGTNGPMITGSLFLPNLLSGFRFSFDYAYARLIGAICLALVPIMLIAGARRIPDNRYAWLGALPIAFTFGLMPFAASLDIVAYNAHHVPMVLCTAGSSLALMAHFGSPRAARVLFFLSGSCLALVLFAKLQWAPVAAACGLMAMVSCVMFSVSVREGVVRATFIAAGGVVVIVLFLGLLSISGQFSDFAHRYVTGQLNYAMHNAALTLAQRVSVALTLHDYANEAMRGALPWLLAASLALWIASAAFALRQRARIRVWSFLTLSTALLLAASIFATVTPGHKFVHYALILVFASLMIFFAWWTYFLLSAGPGVRLLVVCVSVISVFVPLAHGERNLLYDLDDHFRRYHARDCPGGQVAEIHTAIRARTAADEPIAVWGWAHDVFVRTARANANKTNLFHMFLGMYGRPDFYATSFLDELKSRPPRVLRGRRGSRQLRHE